MLVAFPVSMVIVPVARGLVSRVVVSDNG
jgi:hypothetical protein